MKRTLINIGLAIALASFISSCNDSKSGTRPMVEKAKAVRKVGSGKVLDVNWYSLEPDKDGNRGSIRTRFFDNDGDNKTVEQFVASYIKEEDGVWRDIGIKENLLRPNAKPKFDPENKYMVRSTMTLADIKRMDSSYQRSIKDSRYKFQFR